MSLSHPCPVSFSGFVRQMTPTPAVPSPGSKPCSSRRRPVSPTTPCAPASGNGAPVSAQDSQSALRQAHVGTGACGCWRDLSPHCRSGTGRDDGPIHLNAPPTRMRQTGGGSPGCGALPGTLPPGAAAARSALPSWPAFSGGRPASGSLCPRTAPRTRPAGLGAAWQERGHPGDCPGAPEGWAARRRGVLAPHLPAGAGPQASGRLS